MLRQHSSKSALQFLSVVPIKSEGQSREVYEACARQICPDLTKLLLMQQTLVLLKPDCIHRRLVGAILNRFELKGLRLVALKLVQASQSLAEQHYAVHKGKPFYDSLLKFLTSKQ